MYFKELVLKDFRNYTNETVIFHKKVNIITGENAQGKTNLIEALYFLSLGKSFRTFKDSELIGFHKPYCQIHSLYEKQEQECAIDFIIYPDRKEMKCNGIPLKKNLDLLENIYTVVFSPDDLRIVKDEPEKRRKFLDRELCMMDPVYYKALGRYKKALLQRNELLKEEHPKFDVISAWNSVLAEEGSKIITKRNCFVQKLSKVSSELHASITQNSEKLDLSYESDCKIYLNLQDQKKELYQCLEDSLERDLSRRTTTIGPHHDDIKIMIDDIDARVYASQGQQRTAALSLKLAEVTLIREETSEDAVLLLDDVLSELDPSRQEFLFHSLSNVQLFITAAERNETLLKKIPEYRLFRIEKGKIAEMVDVVG